MPDVIKMVYNIDFFHMIHMSKTLCQKTQQNHIYHPTKGQKMPPIFNHHTLKPRYSEQVCQTLFVHYIE